MKMTFYRGAGILLCELTAEEREQMNDAESAVALAIDAEEERISAEYPGQLKEVRLQREWSAPKLRGSAAQRVAAEAVRSLTKRRGAKAMRVSV